MPEHHDHSHHDAACDCGGDHHHDEACGCGEHHHHHDGACGCGHDHHEVKPAEGMCIRQQNMLLALHARRYLPVASFTLEKSDDPSLFAIALEPVYLGTAGDSLEDVKALAAELAELAERGLITLDYDMPLEGYPYTEYETAQVWSYFRQTVAQGAGKPGFLFDTPSMALGSMALTEAGHLAVEGMLDA